MVYRLILLMSSLLAISLYPSSVAADSAVMSGGGREDVLKKAVYDAGTDPAARFLAEKALIDFYESNNDYEKAATIFNHLASDLQHHVTQLLPDKVEKQKLAYVVDDRDQQRKRLQEDLTWERQRRAEKATEDAQTANLLAAASDSALRLQQLHRDWAGYLSKVGYDSEAAAEMNTP